MLSNVLTVHDFFLFREKNVSPDTCAASVATQGTDGLALVMRFLFAAAASTWSHVAFA